MPTATDTEFSYQRDIAPYASRFFSEISSDPRLSQASRTRLQGTLLNGVQDIADTRAKLAAEREKGQMRKLQYASGVEALEDARWKRTQMEQRANQRQALTGTVRQIAMADADPETRRQALAQFALENADQVVGDHETRTLFQIAENAIPQPKEPKGYTPAQLTRLAGKVPQEILESGDPVAIGQAYASAAEEERIAEEAKKMDYRQKTELAKMPLKYQKTEPGEEPQWLEPESTQRARAIVLAMGSPEEKAMFEKLDGPEKDRKRKALVTEIQLRHLSGELSKPAGKAASVGGLMFGGR